MIYVKIASANDDNRPDREDIKSEDNWTIVAQGVTYQQVLTCLVEAANDEEFSIENSWLRITSD